MSQAVLFDAGQPGKRFPGELQVAPGAVVFRDAQGAPREMGLDRLKCRTGGIENRTVYFSHPEHPGVEIVSEELELLSRPPLSELATAKAALASARGYQRRYWLGLGLIGCLVLGGLLVGGGLIIALVRFALGLF